MEETTAIKGNSWRKTWEHHGSAIVTLLCLIFILLAWSVGKYGMSYLEIPFYILAFIVGGYQQAWEGLETLD